MYIAIGNDCLGHNSYFLGRLVTCRDSYKNLWLLGVADTKMKWMVILPDNPKTLTLFQKM